MTKNKIELHLEKPDTHLRIFTEWGYYNGSFGAKVDGYLKEFDYNNKEVIIEFGTIESALEHINNVLKLSAPYELDDQSGSFMAVSEAAYTLSNNQYMSPNFLIRCFKDITEEVNIK